MVERGDAGVANEVGPYEVAEERVDLKERLDLHAGRVEGEPAQPRGSHQRYQQQPESVHGGRQGLASAK